jgi:tripartite-type tricarboxylate transporter receptor subunit TctC
MTTREPIDQSSQNSRWMEQSMTDQIFLQTGLSRRQVFAGAAVLGTAAAATRFGIADANAQAYPSQEIRWIIYQSPGGLIDGSTRTIQPYLKKQGFGSRVEYVRGASGRIARTQLFRSQPDGYTIMTEASPEEVLGEVVYNADYKVAEFQPVFGWFVNAFNIYVQKTSPIKTFADFVKEAKARKVTIGTLGKGGPSHLQLAVLRNKLGLNLQFVHFEGGAPAYSALLGGHVESAIGGSTSNRWIDTVSFLAVFRAGRDPALPNVPTVAELGDDITPVNEVIYANTGPKVPAERIAKLADAFAKAFQDPEHVNQQKNLGVFPTLLSSADLHKMIQNMYGLVNEHKAELAG